MTPKKKDPEPKASDTSTSWLAFLRMEMSMLEEKDLVEPSSNGDEEVEEGESYVGEMPMECRKLWTLFCMKEEQSTRMIVDARYARGDVAKKEEMHMNAYEVRTKAEMCKDLMYLNLKDQFKLWSPHLSIGIRAGWKVVTFRTKMRDNPIIKMLGL